MPKLAQYYAFVQSLFPTTRLYGWGLSAMALHWAAFLWNPLSGLTPWVDALYFAALSIDLMLLYVPHSGIQAKRILPSRLSLGDTHLVEIKVQHRYPFVLHMAVYDEIPAPLQMREWHHHMTLAPGQEGQCSYSIQPKSRGRYAFGSIQLWVRSPLRLWQRRIAAGQTTEVPCYPSFHKLSQYAWLAQGHRLGLSGDKKLRAPGQSQEFEHIEEYVLGADWRQINWKASAKRHKWMVNRFQDEKSRPVFLLLDNSRVMQSSFEGMRLVDYGVNACLALTQTILEKQDKAGLVVFSNRVQQWLPAAAKKGQLSRVMEQLYAVEPQLAESDFSELYRQVNQLIPQRSVLILITHFETPDAVQRQLPYLRALQRKHLLYVMCFEQMDWVAWRQQEVTQLKSAVMQWVAEQALHDQQHWILLLRQAGIRTLYSPPSDLAGAAAQAYLQLKQRGEA